MTDEHKDPGTRKAYQSPQLSVISLRPEEAVLGHCKNTSSAGPVSPSNCTNLGSCLVIGS
jgi:hypothetical protein